MRGCVDGAVGTDDKEATSAVSNAVATWKRHTNAIATRKRQP